jgi:uncharacterized protein YgiM (DUF1202 family)
MSYVMKPMRRWLKLEGPDQKALDSIQRGEMVEVSQGGDNPSKFLYRDMGGHLYWVKLQPYEVETTIDTSQTDH